MLFEFDSLVCCFWLRASNISNFLLRPPALDEPADDLKAAAAMVLLLSIVSTLIWFQLNPAICTVRRLTRTDSTRALANSSLSPSEWLSGSDLRAPARRASSSSAERHLAAVHGTSQCSGSFLARPFVHYV